MFIWLFLFLFVFFIIWIIYGLEYNNKEVNYFNKYEPNIPGDQDPLLANYFIEGKISDNWFISGVLYLVNKKIYVLENYKGKKFLKKVITKDKNNTNLPFYVSEIYSYLDSYFIDNKLDFIEFIKKLENLKYFKKGKNYSVKIKSHNYSEDTFKFEMLSKKISDKYDELFYDIKYFDNKGILVFKIILIIGAVISISVNIFLFLFLAIIFTLLSNIFPIKIILGKFTKEGLLKHLRWVAFKNYIFDYSGMNRSPIEHVILWNDYFVYAITFGIVKDNPLDIEIY